MTAPAPTTAVCDIQCPHLHTPEEASALLGGRPSARTLRDKASRRAIPTPAPLGPTSSLSATTTSPSSSATARPAAPPASAATPAATPSQKEQP